MRETKDIRQSPNVHIAVENFGPIERAEIDLRPLTVFVGESNTGKTYLAALIYALQRTLSGIAASGFINEDISLHSEDKNALREALELRNWREVVSAFMWIGPAKSKILLPAGCSERHHAKP